MAPRVFLGVCIAAMIFLVYVLVNLFLDSKRRRKKGTFLVDRFHFSKRLSRRIGQTA